MTDLIRVGEVKRMNDDRGSGSPGHWDPLHEGEIKAQSKVGVHEDVSRWAPMVIQPVLPEEHRYFYAQLPFVVAAARDEHGAPWATLLPGNPGFMTSPDSATLVLRTRTATGDALEGAFVEGNEVGLLGIDLGTRLRNRVNGSVRANDNKGFTIGVDQAFGNCPQYISKRLWHVIDQNPERSTATRHAYLTDAMQEFIERADTLFVASGQRSPEGRRASDGMDISHRGGAPGFVNVTSRTSMILPDYAGNNLFNTIGNLIQDPRIGILFVDFECGSLLQITGHVEIDWDSPAIAEYSGAQRLLRIEVEQVVHIENAIPLRWDAPEGAVRELQIVAKTQESEDAMSLEFVPRDDGDLEAFQAGQYLPIELVINNGDAIERTYSISSDPAADRYRITVKREPNGLVSRILHDWVKPGDVIRAQSPEGDFVLSDSERSVALVSAGIGITPMVSMLHSLSGQDRQVFFIHGARDGDHSPLAEEVKAVAEANENVYLEVIYSKPGSGDIEGYHYHRKGHVDIAVLEESIPGLDAEFFICGPKRFVSDLASELAGRGVPPERIRGEDFKY